MDGSDHLAALEAKVATLTDALATLTATVATKDARIAELERLLEEVRRSSKRPAAPFSKGKPKDEWEMALGEQRNAQWR